MAVTEILKQPYARMVTPDEDGSYFAEIVEFPGCFATGATAVEALENLEGVAVDWVNATIAQGQNVPEPMEAMDYSGKLVLRMPKGLHKRAALWADREGVSLNQFIVSCVAEHVGSLARPAMTYAQTAFGGMSINVITLGGNGGMFMVPHHGNTFRIPLHMEAATTQLPFGHSRRDMAHAGT